jgi:hypothetical protein
MTFAAPLFLIAAFAFVIPIALHLLHHQKAKDMPFPTLRFLKISVQKTRRRKRVQDVLLMILRAVLLLLIAFGLAGPAVTNLGTLLGGASTAAVIILDNSASMGTIDQDRVRFETATAAATQILDQLGDGDQVALLLTGGPAFPSCEKLNSTQESARQALGQCRVSYERANLSRKLDRARELMEKSDFRNKQIYILTDMQRISWESGEKLLENRGLGTSVPSEKGEGSGFRVQGSEKSNPQSPPPSIILVDCNRTPKPDVAVERIDLETAAPVAGLPVKATVTLLNASTVPLQPRVELLIDGVSASSSPELSIPPGGRVKHDFTFTLNHGGPHRGEARLVGEDGSKYDDRRFFTLEIGQDIPVAVVKDRRHEIPYLDDAFYLEQALAGGMEGGESIHATILQAGDLEKEPLEKYRVLFCVNLPALNAEAAERLAAYLAGGGNIVWICGDNVKPEAYNRMNEQAAGRLLPAPLVDVREPLAAKGTVPFSQTQKSGQSPDRRDSWHVSFLDKKHPALSGLAEPASLYESVLVFKHVRMKGGVGTGHVLARLDDGEPFLIQRKVGNGKTLMLGTSAQVNWSNLPLRTIFLPLVNRLTLDLAKVGQVRRDIFAGHPLELPLADPDKTEGVEVIPPSGEKLRLKPGDCPNFRGSENGTVPFGETKGDRKVEKSKKEENAPPTFRYENTHDIGIYLLRPLGAATSPASAFSVNFDPDEADPVKIERQELESLERNEFRSTFGSGPILFAENPDDLSDTFTGLREGKSLWGLFLAAVLIGLVFETLISNRLSPKPAELPTRGGRG